MKLAAIVYDWIHGGAWDHESVENTAQLGLAIADRERLEETYGDDAHEIGEAIVTECRRIVAGD